VLVVGAGIMGAGIAQVAAQAGHTVWLHDAREGAAAERPRPSWPPHAGAWWPRASRGRLLKPRWARIQPAAQLADAAAAGLVVEAIVEDLAAKRALLQQLETVVSPQCVLATNTSSISVTALANGLAHPGRLVGMHFFNPVPLMKLVEVVSGLHTQPVVAEAIFQLSLAWGKTPVHARSTPGFIVNRIARPYYAEALALLQEQATTPAVLDACFRAAGFRMGPCELMDLIGHDTNFAVTQLGLRGQLLRQALPAQSLVQREMVEGGLLGRKSGRGFYPYPEGAASLPVAVHRSTGQRRRDHRARRRPAGRTPGASRRARWACRAGARRACAAAAGRGWIDGAQLRLSDGRTAAELQAAGPGRSGRVRPPARCCRPHLARRWPLRWPIRPMSLAQQGRRLAGRSGLAPMPRGRHAGPGRRAHVAMLINEAADAVQQGVCTPEGADAAMKLGVNYPAGPFEWLARWSPGRSGACWNRWTTTTAANATASAPGCAAACTARGSPDALKPSSATPSAPLSAATAARCPRCAPTTWAPFRCGR
jgi:3-hydroxybutyryl-CoA dehydrogenase